MVVGIHGIQGTLHQYTVRIVRFCRQSFRLVYILVFLPTGSEGRGVLGVDSISVAILPTCLYVRLGEPKLDNHQHLSAMHYDCIEINVGMTNTSETVPNKQIIPWP